MRQVLQQYAIYNSWANNRIINVVLPLPHLLIDQKIESSFPSLRLTILHCWETELAWWKRLHFEHHVLSFLENKTLPFEQIVTNWKTQSYLWQQWVTDADDSALTSKIVYRNFKNEEFIQPAFQILLHVFNHATYHRGQIVSIFHQLGVAEIPNTDFINWSRNG